ncbi:MAG TPA: hypothetical protein VD710_02385 [Nitrososphaeraceae archaeon]|nr:hypothetical protein [Nitrososphaeraceae archaeon]
MRLPSIIYQVNYVSKKEVGSNLHAVIDCYNGVNHDHVGNITFYDTPLPYNTFTNNIIRIYFDISRFNDIIGLLRYEKPIVMYFDDSSKYGWILAYTYEPVGEEET